MVRRSKQPVQKCPFCDYNSEHGKAMVAHVQVIHIQKWNCCFCGFGVQRPLWELDSYEERLAMHLDAHGGLEAHAQDFLMGIK